jgi:hypothetical protein
MACAIKDAYAGHRGIGPREAEAALDALLAPSRVPCPNPDCVDGWWWCDIDDGEHIKQRCSQCSDGTIEGPSLAERVLGYERVGWADTLDLDGDCDYVVDKELPLAVPCEPVYRRRSPESAPTGGTT